MKMPHETFNNDYKAWCSDVYRLCFVLSRNPQAAVRLTFDTFLRLGAAKEANLSEKDRKYLLFRAALQLCEDYYLHKMRKPPKREKLADALAPLTLTDALWSLLKQPFRIRAAFVLHFTGFAQGDVDKLVGKRASVVNSNADYSKAIASVIITQDEAEGINDRIYERFSERSVGVENAIHGFFSGFDRLAPLLAIGVLLLFGAAVWVSMKMGGAG